MPKAKLGRKIWVNLILFGFTGQVAWAIENIYFNTFLFNYIGATTADISKMVAFSAATAVATTFLMGTLSDKLGRRKVFICAGYILWGVTVMAFAFISRENTAELLRITDTAKVAAATVSIVIIMDCVMTFMGSTSNDAAFNAWVTDVTVPQNRGTAEGILSTMPILATLMVTAGFGAGVAAAGYPACFLALGVLVTLCGFAGLLTLKESGNKIKKQGNYFAELVYGFRPSVVRDNSRLYLALASVCIFSTAVQIFMPYVFLYIQHYLGLDINHLAVTPKAAAVAALALAGFIGGAVGMGIAVDRLGKKKFVFPAVAVFVAGLFIATFVKKLSVFGLVALVIIAGYGLLMIILNASVRDFTPEGKAGLFQGVRMIFFVLIPMVAGPFAGNRVIERFAGAHEAGTYVNDFGETVLVPVPEIFAAAAVLGVFIAVPLLTLRKRNKETEKAARQDPAQDI